MQSDSMQPVIYAVYINSMQKIWNLTKCIWTIKLTILTPRNEINKSPSYHCTHEKRIKSDLMINPRFSAARVSATFLLESLWSNMTFPSIMTGILSNEATYPIWLWDFMRFENDVSYI